MKAIRQRSTVPLKLTIQWSARTIVVNGRTITRSPRFFNLYCLLYLAKLRDEKNNDGAVESETVRQLAGWEKNAPLSIGKQINRYSQQLARKGYVLITADQKVNGPFRLAVKKTHLSADVSPETLEAFLFPLASQLRTNKTDDQLYQYVSRMSAASLDLDDGRLREALKEFEAAARQDERPYFRAIALQNVARVLERLGDYKSAFKCIDDSLETLRHAREYRDWAEARSFTLKAMLHYRLDQLDAAEKLYRKALTLVRGTSQLRVLGDIYNGLGNICAARQLYNDALGLYQQALEHWVLIENINGVQIIYFNIGRLYLRWAKQLHDTDSNRATRHYNTAKTWFEHCIRLCAQAGIGYDDNDAEIGLSSAYRHTGELDKALRFAKEALGIAEGSGNARGLRNAYRSLLKAHLARGNRQKADALLTAARSKFDRDFIEQLESLMPDSGTDGKHSQRRSAVSSS